VKSYIVGGYVRDKLLGVEPSDRDWVVVGASPEQMLAQGFQMVGRGFPVFLHPETHEVYALARTDIAKKIVEGKAVFSDLNVTLEEDLARRDLTINAMAFAEDSRLIDPFGGRDDINNRILKHVGPAFKDDPIRVLRLARFAARFEFDIADETVDIVSTMLADGAFDSLTPERVWGELEKALIEDRPDLFIQTLKYLGILKRIFPELDSLFGMPDKDGPNSSTDAGSLLLTALKVCGKVSSDPLVRFGVLVHSLGKRSTDVNSASFDDDSDSGVTNVEKLFSRSAIPAKFQRFGRICARYFSYIHSAFELDPVTIVRIFRQIGGLNRVNDIDRFLLVCEVDFLSRQAEKKSYSQANYIKNVFDAISKVSIGDIDSSILYGKEIGNELERLRVSAAERVKDSRGCCENDC